MTETWTTAGGVDVPDRVPARPRHRHAEQGPVPGRGLCALFRARAAAHPERPSAVGPEGTLDRRARRIATARGTPRAPGVTTTGSVHDQ
ncbi:hypothetical protein ACWEQ7_26390 [Streptomyces sp. NPDC004069]